MFLINLRSFPFVGQSCVNESQFEEQVVYVGQRALPYRLQCPLKSVPPQSSAQIQITWLKDCRKLPSQVTQTFLDFPSIRFEDEGNYTCVVQDNSTASFTVHLRVKGESYHVFKGKMNFQYQMFVLGLHNCNWGGGGGVPSSGSHYKKLYCLKV